MSKSQYLKELEERVIDCLSGLKTEQHPYKNRTFCLVSEGYTDVSCSYLCKKYKLAYHIQGRTYYYYSCLKTKSI